MPITRTFTQTFEQTPPRLDDQYGGDTLLRGYLARTLPPDVLAEIEPELAHMGARAGDDLYALHLADRPNEPRLTQWDAWGRRCDQIELTRGWQEAERLAAQAGLVATAYERRHGPWSRLHQFALVYLFVPSTDMYGCPLAMSDGAARTLLDSANRLLIDRALPHLLSRDPAHFWTSGQWMTELTGGSDVGSSETHAQQEADGGWRLWGRKWFTSAATSQMALTLARPTGNPPGGKGLALFYVETQGADGLPDGLRVERLKEKLGTRKLPTAELTLEGLSAIPVYGLSDGVRNITPMLNITRLWNSITAAAYLRRAVALSESFAQVRRAFGAALADLPLHADTLAGLRAEQAAAFHLAFFVAELVGRLEAGEARPGDDALLRLATPIAKLTTAKQAVAGCSEALEAHGGAGYVEDTGLPTLLRDAQVLPIWEGTTNVLALELLRGIQAVGGLDCYAEAVRSAAAAAQEPGLARAAQRAVDATEHALTWLRSADGPARMAGARRLALTLGRSLALALLARHAQWAMGAQQDEEPRRLALRYAAARIDEIVDE